jgi:hypothetical protein
MIQLKSSYVTAGSSQEPAPGARLDRERTAAGIDRFLTVVFENDEGRIRATARRGVERDGAGVRCRLRM